MTQPIIAIIGAGKMGSGLIAGLIKAGYPPQCLWATDPDNKQLQSLQKTYRVHITTENATAIAAAQIVLFAIKPQIFKTVVATLSQSIHQYQPLIISIAAGVTMHTMQQILNNKVAIIRAMPNLSVCIGQGVTAFYTNANVSDTQRQQTATLFGTVGMAIELHDETLLDTITALSGSGPGYLFHLMHALEQTAIAMGLKTSVAHQLTIQTVLGAAQLALHSPLSFQALQHSVASKGGTTEAAITVLDQNNVQHLYATAMHAAKKRATELSQ